MKNIKITESTVNEAMAQIDLLPDLTDKNRDCIRLLTEEMYSMVSSLLNMGSPDFQVGREGNLFTLQISAHTNVSDEAREHFMSMSSNGRNAAAKGLKGVLGSVLESFFYEGSVYTVHQPWSCGLNTYDADYQMWDLSHYIESTSYNTEKKEWDELEKSIITKFADNVVIGVRSGKLEMTVTKTF